MPGAEPDTSDDKQVAQTRDTGGDPGARGADAPSSTGTGPNDTFVGRTAGQDEGYDEETGAEARSAG